MITSVTISQDNIINGSNLLPIHSPLSFLIDAEYTGEYPTSLLVDILFNGDVIKTLRAIPFKDILGNTRQFVFVANDLKAIMEPFNDILQDNESLASIGNITKEITVRAYSPDDDLIFDEVAVVLIHGAAQFGENPNFDQIFNGQSSTYYGADGEIVYIYVYNESEDNEITVDDPNPDFVIVSDYDDEDFADYDDELFEIQIA